VIEEEIQDRERTVAVPQPTVKKSTKELSTAATLLTGRCSGPTCTYCQKSHASNSCGVVTQVHARRQVLQKSGRCFVCLRRGHISRECRSNMKCSKCKGRHHVSICPNTLTDSTGSGQTGSTILPSTTQSQTDPAINQFPVGASATERPGLNAEAPSFQSQNCHSTSLWVNSDQAVLLQTAQALVFNPTAPQMSRHVRMVLDCGSQRSYITDQVVKELSLVPEGEQSLTIMTFGSSEERSRVCKSVRLDLALKNGQMKQLTLFTVPSFVNL